MHAFGHMTIKKGNFFNFDPLPGLETGFQPVYQPQPGGFPHFNDQRADFALCRRNALTEYHLRPGQVVGRLGEDRLHRHLWQGHETRFAQPAHGLCPAEDFLDPLADLQARLIADMPPGAPVDGVALGLLRHIRRHPRFAHVRHELGHVITLVGPQGHRFGRRARHHHLGRFPFRHAAGRGGPDIHRHALQALHQCMAQVAHPRFLAFALLVQVRIRICGRFMGLVGTLLALEDHRRVAATNLRRRSRAVLLPEALHRGPGFDQGAVHIGAPRKTLESSLRRKPEPSEINKLDSGLRRNDGFFEAPIDVLVRHQFLPFARLSTLAKSDRAIVSLSRRSRLALKIEWFHTASSMPRLTNQWYSWL